MKLTDKIVTCSKIWLFFIFIVPIIGFIFIGVFRNSVTLTQAGLILQLFSILPLGTELWERLYISRKNEGFFIYDIRKWFKNIGLRRISNKPSDKFEDIFRQCIIIYGIIWFFLGLSFQLTAAFRYMY